MPPQDPKDSPATAEQLRKAVASELAATESIDARRRDLQARIAALRAQLRGGPLTVGKEPTAVGHVTSAISELGRELEGLR